MIYGFKIVKMCLNRPREFIQNIASMQTILHTLESEAKCGNSVDKSIENDLSCKLAYFPADCS